MCAIGARIERMKQAIAHIALIVKDYDEAIDFYTTQIDLSWLQPPYPSDVKRTVLVSADRDLLPEDIEKLRSRYSAVAGDWESGAIAWVAARNRTRSLILRTVSDVVDREGGSEARHPSGSLPAVARSKSDASSGRSSA